MRGPKPQSAAVKEQRGNPGRRKIGADPEIVASGVVVAPDYLADEALKIWNKIVPRLVALKLITETDVMTFGRYCRNYARWMDMQKRLDDADLIYEVVTASGTVMRTHPAFLIADRLDRKLETVEDRFGLNPAERQRIFAVRAASGNSAPDLFGHGENKPSAGKPAGATMKTSGPIGLLN